MVQVEVVATTVGEWFTVSNGKEYRFSNSTTASGTGDINSADEVVKKVTKESQRLNFVNAHNTLAKWTISQELNFTYNTDNISSVTNTTFTKRVIE